MEFHVIRTDLLSELQLINGVIEKKNTMPILANVRLEAADNQLTLQATDLEVGLISQCAAQVIEPGELTVNAKQLQDILNTLGEEQVSFAKNEGTMLDLACGSARFSIETMSTQDFPTIPECDFSSAFQLQNGFFLDCINKILFSVSSDPHKYALNGGLLRTETGEMSLVSTDGHRMSLVHRQVGPEFRDLDIIVPRKTLMEVKKSLQMEDSDEQFEMDFSDNRIFFRIGPRVLFSRLIDGKFPDYNKALPMDNDKSFVFDRKQFLDIIRRKAVLSTDKSKLVRLTFEKNEMVVVLKNAERGESIDRLGIEYDGESISVGFNVDYLQDFLKNMVCEKIEVKLRDEASQGLFQIADDETGDQYKHVIMPMRLTG
jgi:DNA polymerase-3 subunit beta